MNSLLPDPTPAPTPTTDPAGALPAAELQSFKLPTVGATLKATADADIPGFLIPVGSPVPPDEESAVKADGPALRQLGVRFLQTPDGILAFNEYVLQPKEAAAIVKAGKIADFFKVLGTTDPQPAPAAEPAPATPSLVNPASRGAQTAAARSAMAASGRNVPGAGSLLNGL